MNEHNIRKLSVMKRALAIAWAFGVLLFVVGPAHAGTLDVLNAFTLGPNTVSDNSGDELINGANGTTAGSTIVQPGSILLATFGMNSITNAAGINGIGTGTGYTQLNGLIAVQCLSETSSNGGFSATFGPATSQADLAAIGAVSPSASAAIAGWASGTMVGVYDVGQGTATNYSRSKGTLDADILTAISGTELWQFGFTGSGGNAALGEGWAATVASNDISVVGATPSPANAGVVNFSLNQTAVTPFSNMLGVEPSVVDSAVKVALNGSSNLLGTGGQTTDFQAFDNSNVTLNVVPEPSSFCAVGCGVWALAVVGRRRTRA